MDTIDYIFILIAYVVAAAIKGLTGIGFSTSCLPIMALRLDLTVAIPLVIIPSIVSNIAIMAQTGGLCEAVKRFWPLYASSVPGLLIGLSILVTINPDAAKLVLGFVLITYTIWALTSIPPMLPVKWEKNLKVVVGFLTGFINGLTGSQVLPVLPYLMSLNLKKNFFIQSINISFTLSSLILLFTMSQLDYLARDSFLIAIGGLIPLLLIVYICGRLRQRLPGELYRKLVLFFLLVMGFILALKSIL